MIATHLARVVSFWIPQEKVQEFWIISGSAREKLICACVCVCTHAAQCFQLTSQSEVRSIVKILTFVCSVRT